MAQEMGVDDALGKVEAEARHENIVELFPEECGVEFIGFHGFGIQEELKSPRGWQSAAKGKNTKISRRERGGQ